MDGRVEGLGEVRRAHATAGELSDVRAAVEAGLLQPVGLPEVTVAPAARTEL